MSSNDQKSLFFYFRERLIIESQRKYLTKSAIGNLWPAGHRLIHLTILSNPLELTGYGNFFL